MKRLLVGLGLVGSAALISGSLSHLLPMDITEVLGFITGAVSVWLTMEENIWNWPVGIANSVFYIVVVLRAQLYSDMSLQFVYVALGFLGWYFWLRGGRGKTTLPVGRVGWKQVAVLSAILVVGTASMTRLLISAHDSAPFLDAVTTVLSLIAEYMLTRKLFENWLVWISADVIYIGLYLYKSLYLTALLYVIFAAMCVGGLFQWRRSLPTGTKSVVEVLDRAS